MRYLSLHNVLSDALNRFVSTAYVIRNVANNSAIIAKQLVSSKGTVSPIRLRASPKDIGCDPLNILLASIPLEGIK